MLRRMVHGGSAVAGAAVVSSCRHVMCGNFFVEVSHTQGMSATAFVACFAVHLDLGFHWKGVRAAGWQLKC